MNFTQMLLATASAKPEAPPPVERSKDQIRSLRATQVEASRQVVREAFLALGNRVTTDQLADYLQRSPSSINSTLRNWRNLNPPLVRIAGKLPNTHPRPAQYLHEWIAP